MAAEDPLTTHARARVGRTLRNKWTLDRMIGVGGMAAVYAATHRNGSKVAIKMLHPTLMYDTNFAQRLVQEGYVANKINHWAAVKVQDDDTDEADGAVFLVMELLEGVTLSQARRKRKKFPALEVFKLLDPVIECLASAHEKGIIHRDIKPENLFLTKENVVRVLDFGIARMNDNSNVSATRAGMVVGSPAYMSPEQALGKSTAVGPPTDVYAVGATMFSLITGTTPHAGESTQEMIVMVATQAARSISTVMADLPPAIVRVIDKSLAYDREKRYPDARAMLHDVRAAVAEIEGTPRVLPTFSDDDDEGETAVLAALEDDDPVAAPPLPAAGLNRVGARPATGKFDLPTGTPQPIGDAFGMSPAAPGTASKARPPTMAPIGAPAVPGGFQPGPPSMAGMPGQGSGMHSMPGFGSGQHMAPMPGSNSGMNPGPFPSGMHGAPMQAQGPQFGFNPDGSPQGGLPPTMAIPQFDMGNMPGPGVASGPRPGATTNMAWTAPPTVPGEEPPPAVRKPRTALFAAAAVGVLALGGVAFAVIGGGNGTTPQPAVVRAARPQIPRVPVVNTPPAVAQNTPAVAGQPDASTVPEQPALVADNADAAVELPGAPVEQADAQVANTDPPEQEDDNAHSGRRHGHGDSHAAPSGGDRPHHGRPRRPGRTRDPLGY